MKDGKAVLFLALEYPYGSNNGNLYTDLMEEFSKHDFRVCVIASASEGGRVGHDLENGIEVVRVNTWFHQNPNLLKKGWSHLTLPYLYKKAIQKYFGSVTFSMVLIPTPPITLLHTVKYAKEKFSIPCYLILRDIFPQNAVDLGMMRRNGILHRYFMRIEKELYEVADRIGCMSPKNIQYVCEKYPALRSKTHILRNWQKMVAPSELDVDSIKGRFGLQKKFIVFYGGNISKPQKTDNIISVAKKLESEDDIIFFFVGKGGEKERLKRRVEKERIENVRIVDFLPRDEYEQLLQIADVGLVSLDENFTIPNIPSKSISYFGAKKPIVAMIDASTDFGTWVQDEIGAGFWAAATDYDKVVALLKYFKEHPKVKEKMGAKGYDYAISHLQPEHAFSVITDAIECL